MSQSDFAYIITRDGSEYHIRRSSVSSIVVKNYENGIKIYVSFVNEPNNFVHIECETTEEADKIVRQLKFDPPPYNPYRK